MRPTRTTVLLTLTLAGSPGLAACAPGSGNDPGAEPDGEGGTAPAAAEECTDVELRLSHQ